MRKSTKIAVVLAAAALLVAGFAFTTLAKGWVKEAEGLYYYEDEYGMKVYNEWKKDPDPNTGEVKFYYLGDDGYMVTNTLVWDNDGYHWCGADGARVSNQWVKVPASEEDQNDLGVDYRWYRFNAKGIAVTGKQTVEGETYFFDGDGKMLYGYVSVDSTGAVTGWTTKASESYVPTSSDVYYCGTNEEGKALKSAWRKESKDTSGDSWEGADSFWAFYQPTGKRASSALTNGALWNGVRYYFDENGKMLSGWQPASRSNDDHTATWSVAEYYGGGDDGKMVKKAWIRSTRYGKADGETDEFWFYFDNTGAAIQKTGVYKINGKFYAFGEKDEVARASKMLSGMVALYTTDDEPFEYITDENVKAAKVKTGETKFSSWLDKEILNVYFFSNDEKNDGSLKKSTSFEQEFQDDTYTLYVDKEGKLNNGYISKKYYKNGYLMKAASDARYEVKNVWYFVEKEGTVEAHWDNKYVVLNATGGEITKGYVADADGNYFVVKDGEIFKADSSLLAPAQTASAWNNKAKDKDATFKYDGKTYKVEVSAYDKGVYKLTAVVVK